AVEQTPGLVAGLVRVPSYAEEGFRFAPLGTLAELRARYAAGRTYEELRRVLEDAFAATQEEPARQASLARWLADVATSPAAAATAARTAPQTQLLEIRMLAVDMLARLTASGSSATRDALVRVAGRTPDTSLVRGHALTQVS